MASVDVEKLSIVRRSLYAPPLEEIKDVLSSALPGNFAQVKVEVVDCPDLTREPFVLSSSGLGGNQMLLEVGGPSFLLPLVQREKLYDIRPLLKRLNYGDEAFVIGAGAGPYPYLNSNCEMMMNIFVSPDGAKNGTRISSVDKTSGDCILETLAGDETRFALLANLFVSKGKPGKVVEVHAKRRTGSDDFVASIRNALAARYEDKLVGFGGTFAIKEGKAKQHVMPDFSTVPLRTNEDLDNWLRFYDMSAPLVAVGTAVTRETDLDFRVQHFHSFSHHGEGGHYHIDTTPETVEYLGYFNVADTIYRVDQPCARQDFGKD